MGTARLHSWIDWQGPTIATDLPLRPHCRRTQTSCGPRWACGAAIASTSPAWTGAFVAVCVAVKAFATRRSPSYTMEVAIKVPAAWLHDC